jgi:hypothetical protein
VGLIEEALFEGYTLVEPGTHRSDPRCNDVLESRGF